MPASGRNGCQRVKRRHQVPHRRLRSRRSLRCRRCQCLVLGSCCGGWLDWCRSMRGCRCRRRTGSWRSRRGCRWCRCGTGRMQNRRCLREGGFGSRRCGRSHSVLLRHQGYRRLVGQRCRIGTGMSRRGCRWCRFWSDWCSCCRMARCWLGMR